MYILLTETNWQEVIFVILAICHCCFACQHRSFVYLVFNFYSECIFHEWHLKTAWCHWLPGWIWHMVLSQCSITSFCLPCLCVFWCWGHTGVLVPCTSVFWPWGKPATVSAQISFLKENSSLNDSQYWCHRGLAKWRSKVSVLSLKLDFTSLSSSTDLCKETIWNTFHSRGFSNMLTVSYCSAKCSR